MIKYYNRKSKKYEIEQVAGDTYLNWIYSSPIGMRFLELLIKKKIFSKLYGHFCDKKSSKKKISSFVKDFNIDLSCCEKKINDFECFNDFFTRKLIPASRPINTDINSVVSPGDGKLLAYKNINLNNVFNIKGYSYSLSDLINNNEVASTFEGGSCIILRLCPTDYHRFHFVDDGICSTTTKIKGDYYSVNPIALKKIPDLFFRNKREWCIFHSKHFGELLHVEVGATCVGSILQTYTPDKNIKKGSEKGFFKFGGSTTILFFKRNSIVIDQDLIEQTNNGYETQILMGEKIGKKF
ncbi:phosphatidylserine decarboxylase [Clostridium sp. P21]|uniref:Phosphatidylserine decarboxylase proenzyme n=1 Tax=Clostridium muellerianum TaxID=2716538 RepID=A0A7Y0HPD8_9CLOT|nr:phosphatidylserine decarboxylase [Clostridium muellerianum]NMM64125.1 phosphatidylserine decarboxylase [Clostridium muellerianum]